MKLVIDAKVCLKNKLSPQEVLVAIAVRSSKDSLKSIVDNLLNRQVLALMREHLLLLNIGIKL